MQTNSNPLPLADNAEHAHPGSVADPTRITVPKIRTMVERFYAGIRDDELLGPIFTGRVQDWDAHLDTMTRFWSSATLRTGTYAGRPIEAHRFAEPGLLTPEHFVRWVLAFSRTAREVFAQQDAAVFVGLARRMAISISVRLGVRGVERRLDESPAH